jgi:RecQ mediated genome instability protein
MSLLSLDLPPGSKVKLRASHTPIRRGTAMLSAECLVLLGGAVERLAAFKPLQGLSSSEAHQMDVVHSGTGQMPPPLFNSRPMQVVTQKLQQPIQQQPIHQQQQQQQQQPMHQQQLQQQQQQQQQQQYSAENQIRMHHRSNQNQSQNQNQNQNASHSLQTDGDRNAFPIMGFHGSSGRGDLHRLGHDSLVSPAPSSSMPQLQSEPLHLRRQQDEYRVSGGAEIGTNVSYSRVRATSPVSRDAEKVLDLCSPGTPPSPPRPHSHSLSARTNNDKSLLPAGVKMEDSLLHGSLNSTNGGGGGNGSGGSAARGDPDRDLTVSRPHAPQSQSRLDVPVGAAQPAPTAHSAVLLPASASAFGSGWNSPATKYPAPQSAPSSSTVVDGRVRKAPLSVGVSVSTNQNQNPNQIQNQIQNPHALPYVSLATVAAAMSAVPGVDTSADSVSGHNSSSSRRLPLGDFNVRGTAVNIRKFRVTEADGYLVLLSLEEETIESDVRNMPQGGGVVVPVLVSNDLCVKYLELAPADYLLKLKNIGKEEVKSVKTSHSLKFRDFRGSFRARIAPGSAVPVPGDRGLSGGTGATPVKSSSSSSGATSQGEDPLLLLVDFYD